jgi:hypothetical protein
MAIVENSFHLVKCQITPAARKMSKKRCFAIDTSFEEQTDSFN